MHSEEISISTYSSHPAFPGDDRETSTSDVAQNLKSDNNSDFEPDLGSKKRFHILSKGAPVVLCFQIKRKETDISRYEYSILTKEGRRSATFFPSKQ